MSESSNSHGILYMAVKCGQSRDSATFRRGNDFQNGERGPGVDSLRLGRHTPQTFARADVVRIHGIGKHSPDLQEFCQGIESSEPLH
jgi:hypothetical protein